MSELGARERRLLEEAAEWRLIGLLFECPGAGWREQVATLGAETADGALRAAAEAARAEATEGFYHSLFGPGGPVSAREAGYREAIALGHLMSELSAYYGAFAYQPVTLEVADHISVEAGFIGYLRLKEAYALASGEAERAAVAAEAARRFTEDHLTAMAEPLAGRLAAAGPRYLVLAAEALRQRVAMHDQDNRARGGLAPPTGPGPKQDE